MPVFFKRREMAQPVLTKAFLQLAKAAAMCKAIGTETHAPTSPYPHKTYLQNGLRQLITCGQSCMTSTPIISG